MLVLVLEGGGGGGGGVGEEHLLVGEEVLVWGSEQGEGEGKRVEEFQVQALQQTHYSQLRGETAALMPRLWPLLQASEAERERERERERGEESCVGII